MPILYHFNKINIKSFVLIIWTNIYYYTLSDFCYRNIPPVDTASLNIVRKLLLAAVSIK